MEALLIFVIVAFLIWRFAKGISRENHAEDSKPPKTSSKTYTLKPSSDRLLSDVEEAMDDRRRLWIKYESERGDVSERKIEIYETSLFQGTEEYLHAWCCLRNEPRTFKIDRIKQWTLLSEHFEHNPQVARWWADEYPRGKDAVPWTRWKELQLKTATSNTPSMQGNNPEDFMTGWELQNAAREHLATVNSSEINEYAEVIRLFELSVKRGVTLYTQAQTHRTLGEIYQRCEQRAKAIEHYEVALKLDPNVGVRKVLGHLKSEN